MALELIKKQDAYTPNLQDKRVLKRVSSVLDWCDANLYEHTVVNVRSVPNKKLPGAGRLSLSEVFGQQQTPLAKWLRHQLLIQVGGYEPGKMNYGYKLRKGAIARLRGMMGQAALAMTDVQKYEQTWQAELEALQFSYLDKSSRLWHPLQNIRRQDKNAFWSNYLPYDYDISACAPNLLAQTARLVGLAEDKLAGVQEYLDEKGAFREHVRSLTGLTSQQAKAVINSLSESPRLW